MINGIDYLVVGGGTAGAVVAARLSEDPSCRVMLVEAGRDLSADGLPAAARDVGMLTVFKPDYFGKPIAIEHPAGPGSNQTRKTVSLVPQVIGGGSFVNGMQAARGRLRDYERWKEFGIEGWGASDVLPYFRKIENDHDFRGPEHGTDGPVHIRRVDESRWSRLTHGIEEAFAARGVRRVADLNDGVSGDGFGAVPLNIGPEGRMSTANAYLTPEVRRRTNLEIVPETRVLRVLFSDGAVNGVECEGPAGRQVIHAANVVLCGGAILSPTILQRSGIGPGALLQSAGVDVVADRAGVGRNLLHHAIISINAHLAREARVKRPLREPCPTVVRYSSFAADVPDADLYLYAWERVTPSLPDDHLSAQLADFMLQMNYCHSVGEITIRPQDAAADPLVRTGLLSDERDRRRMYAAVTDLVRMLSKPPLSHLVNAAIFVHHTPFSIKTMEDTAMGRVLNMAAAMVLGGPKIVRETVLSRFTTRLDGLADEDIGAIVRDNCKTTHPAGSCRLGAQDDPLAVVDSRGKVIGVDGLRVVDASILPALSFGGTNLPTNMAAEKIADAIKEDRRAGIFRAPARAHASPGSA